MLLILEVQELGIQITDLLLELTDFLCSLGDVYWDQAVTHLFFDLADACINCFGFVEDGFDDLLFLGELIDQVLKRIEISGFFQF